MTSTVVEISGNPMKIRLNGIITPIVTPFKENEELDLAKLRQHVRFLLESGVHGILGLGTAGEFALLSPTERREVLSTIVEEVNGRVPVLAGVFDPGTRNVVSYAKDAVDVGVDLIVVTTPYFFRSSEEGIYTHFDTISREVDKPIVIYHIPSATGHSISLELASKLSEIDRVVGMKYTSNDFSTFVGFVRTLGDKISILTGVDSLIYSSLDAGGAGAVVGCSNVFPREAVRIYELYRKGDLRSAREIQLRILPFINVMFTGTFPAALKEASRMLGMDLGPVRKPLTPLTENEREMVSKALEKVRGSQRRS